MLVPPRATYLSRLFHSICSRKIGHTSEHLKLRTETPSAIRDESLASGYIQLLSQTA